MSSRLSVYLILHTLRISAQSSKAGFLDTDDRKELVVQTIIYISSVWRNPSRESIGYSAPPPPGIEPVPGLIMSRRPRHRTEGLGYRSRASV